MLTHIFIKNFAIVDSLEIDFQQGLSVLTGETGAGKSLWVDALNLALGQRADSSWVRQGCERSEISVSFDITNLPQACDWLKSADLSAENDCIIRRIIPQNGSSRCSINGTPVPLVRVRELANHLIHIHSQHSQQHITQSEQQRHSLDVYAGLLQLVDSVAELYFKWHSIQQEVNYLKEKTGNKQQEIEFLRYQLEELNQLSIQAGEWQTLSQQHQQLHNAQSLLQHLSTAIDLTQADEKNSAAHAIETAIQALQQVKISDPELNAIIELLNTAHIHISEAGNALDAYRNRLDINNSNAEQIEARLSQIYNLARKHHCNPQDLPDTHQSLQQKLDTLLQLDEKIADLLTKQKIITEKYHKLAKKLSSARKKHAKKLSEEITKAMRLMDIQDGIFDIAFAPIKDTLTAHGLEKICFMVQTNAGLEMQPLQKIASGGEISRICLAMHVLTASKEQTPTLVFDEVDVGMGGKTAAIIGQQLRELGQQAQVLCITHLPQVAANGHHHYCVSKHSDGKRTTTEVRQLSQAERVEEIARMLGGTKITKQTRLNAKELLS